MKRKILKKVLAVILSASMILGTGIVALADDEPREIPWVWQKTADGHRGSFEFESGEIILYTQNGGADIQDKPVDFVSHEYDGSTCSVCGYERADESSCS